MARVGPAGSCAELAESSRDRAGARRQVAIGGEGEVGMRRWC